MTLRKPLGLTLSEPLRSTLGSTLGLGMPYSLLPTPLSYLPSPSWLPNLYLTCQGTTRKAWDLRG
jgi:hypothetical protein